MIVLALVFAAQAGTVKVPVDVGVGPAWHWWSGPIAAEQVHMGAVVNVEAVITKQWVKKNKKKIPKKYRSYAKNIEEARISPLWWLPDTYFVSPGADTSVWGASWRPVGLLFPLVKGDVAVRGGLGLRITYAFIDSDTLGDTHFLRPGLDGRLELDVKVAKHWRVSGGWTSMAHIPQGLGGGVDSLGEPGDRAWHVGQAFAKVHYRFKYKTRI